MMNYLFPICIAVSVLVTAGVLYLFLKLRYGSTVMKTILFWGIIGLIVILCVVYSVTNYTIEVRNGGFSSISAAIKYYEDIDDENVFLTYNGDDTVYVAYYSKDGHFSNCILKISDGKYIKTQSRLFEEGKQNLEVFLTAPEGSNDIYVRISYLTFDDDVKTALEITDSMNTNYAKIDYKYDNALEYIGTFVRNTPDFWIEVNGERFNFDLT